MQTRVQLLLGLFHDHKFEVELEVCHDDLLGFHFLKNCKILFTHWKNAAGVSFFVKDIIFDTITAIVQTMTSHFTVSTNSVAKT